MAGASPVCSRLTLLLLSLSLTLPIAPSHSAPPSDTFIFGGCSRQSYDPNSPYDTNLNSLLTSLVNSATYSSYSNFTVTGSSPQDVVYGLYQCRGDLSMPDCASCIMRAVSRVGELCSKTCGGVVQFQGCYIKYDNETFLGVEDKTVVFKKCGPSDGYGAETMGRRDAVLASLTSSGGTYRVGGSGQVQGLAQCTGDLSMGECQDCVSEAIGLLKSECSSTVYGDMFLGKCYVRYSSGGGGGGSGGGGAGGGSGNGEPTISSNPPDDNGKSSNDEGEKTFAILVGLLAGVALIVIFVAFLRKVAEGNGK